MTASDILTVQGRADEHSPLRNLIADRERTGTSRFDEWWNGVYRIVTGPSWEHGEVALRLGAMLLPLADSAGLKSAAPANIGVDKVNARVPDLAFARPDVQMTSPAFAATAELVVEILSPGEIAGEKLPFYAESGVAEYLEIDLANGTCRLLSTVEGDWVSVIESSVLEFQLDDVAALLHG